MKSSHITTYIVVAKVLGIAIGVLINDQAADHAAREGLADYVSYGSMICLRLVKLIIASLVLSTLIAGIGRMPDVRAVGRSGAKAIIGGWQWSGSNWRPPE